MVSVWSVDAGIGFCVVATSLLLVGLTFSLLH